jgi:hypothetical protein
MIDLVESACGAKSVSEGLEQGTSVTECNRGANYAMH